MIKKCVILNNNIINIGEWDSKPDRNGIDQNPMPEGAMVEERDFEYNADRGWFETGTTPKPTEEQKLQAQIETMQGALDFIVLNY